MHSSQSANAPSSTQPLTLPQQPPTSAPPTRSRVTVVCAECKRLKLKCDRRNPCASCTKRDTVVRCTYSAAAAEKVDLHSVNNRLIEVESALTKMTATTDEPFIPSFVPPSSSSNNPTNPKHPPPSHPTAPDSQPRTLLATGVGHNSSSIAVNMGDMTSLYLNNLGIKPSFVVSPSNNDDSVKMEVNALHQHDSMSPQDDDIQGFSSIPEDHLSLPSTQVTPALVAQLLPLSALDPIEYVVRMHVFINWRHLRSRISAILDVFYRTESAHAMFFGHTQPPLLRRQSSSPSSQPPPTLSMYALAAASFALSGLLLDGPFDPCSQRGEAVSDPHSPAPRESRMITLEGKPTTPRKLLMLSEHALRMFESTGMSFDLEYMKACILQTLCGLYGGSVVSGRKQGGLECGVFANIGKIVNIARMMGLTTDPDEFSASQTLWEKEMRRRVWWDVYYYDLFVSDCMGQQPLIVDNSFTTKMPSDVDENAFSPLSNILPTPKFVEGSENALQYFELKCRLARLVKDVKQRMSNEGQPYSIDRAASLEEEVHRWLRDLPALYHLQSDEPPSTSSQSSSSPSPSSSAADSYPPLSPILIAQQCEMAITAQRLIMRIYFPFLENRLSARTPPHQASHGTINAAHAIIEASRALWISRGRWKGKATEKANLLYAMFRFYSFGKAVFDAAVVCADAAIRLPSSVWAGSALDDVESALEVMRDPAMFVSRGAVRVVELLKRKADRAMRSGCSSRGLKRKLEEVEDEGDDDVLVEGFELPYVGPGVLSAGIFRAPEVLQMPTPASSATEANDSIGKGDKSNAAQSTAATRSTNPGYLGRGMKHAKIGGAPERGKRYRPPKGPSALGKEDSSSSIVRLQPLGQPPPSQAPLPSPVSSDVVYPHMGSMGSSSSLSIILPTAQQGTSQEYTSPLGGSDSGRVDTSLFGAHQFSAGDVGPSQQSAAAYGQTQAPAYGQHGNTPSPYGDVHSSPYSEPGSSKAGSPFGSVPNAGTSSALPPPPQPPSSTSSAMYPPGPGLDMATPQVFGHPISPQTYYAPTRYGPPSYAPLDVGHSEHPSMDTSGGMISSPIHYDPKAMERMYEVKSAEASMQRPQPFVPSSGGGGGHEMAGGSQMVTTPHGWSQQGTSDMSTSGGHYWNHQPPSHCYR